MSKDSKGPLARCRKLWYKLSLTGAKLRWLQKTANYCIKLAKSKNVDMEGLDGN